MNIQNLLRAGLITAAIALSHSAWALDYDQDVTPDVIFGSGNLNGSFTVDRQNGLELGLRAKVRYNAMGVPENTFNSNGDGTYSFATGGPVAPIRPRWSFEWSVNADFDGSSGGVLSDYTYAISLDGDPSCLVDALVFDPITPGVTQDCWDHSLGDNSTPNGGGFETDCGAAGADATYAANVAAASVAQNSWSYAFFLSGPLAGFDRDADGSYDISLTAFDASGAAVASTTIRILVGTGGDADSDGDGVCDSLDACGDSDTGTILIGDCDTGVPNVVDETGCTLADAIAACAMAAANHGDFVSCVAHATNEAKAAGLITGAAKGAIQRCAARSDIP